MILQSEDDEEKSVASVSAILFFVLALQTGVTSLDGEKRFHQLCKNLCLLLTGKNLHQLTKLLNTGFVVFWDPE
jgi:E3 ubiquitin-protein ligase RNF139